MTSIYKIDRNASKLIRAGALTFTVLLGLVLLSAKAYAAGPAVFSANAPAPLSTVTTTSTGISIAWDDTADLDSSSLSVTVNGVPVAATVSHKEVGHYEDGGFDTCGFPVQVFVRDGYDYTAGTITARAAGLPDGPITVLISLKNTAGITSNYSWTFNVKVPPAISQPSPAYSSIGNLRPLITAKVTDNGTIADVKMYINNTLVSSAFASSTGIVSYTPAFPLPNYTTYNVKVTATDGIGAATTTTWFFHTLLYQDALVSGGYTDCHVGYPEAGHPMNNCEGCHGGAQPIGECRGCHGYDQHSGSSLQNYFCDYCHNATYSYKIPVHPADNVAYHNTTTNMDTCGQCHQTSLSVEHFQRKDSTGAAFTCQTCHNSTNPAVQLAIANKQKDCGVCHGQATEHEAAHANSVLDNKCTSCHINSLTQEHLTNEATQAAKLTCDTCHRNNNSSVANAINGADKNCAACHHQGHNLLFGEMVPNDIPLYDGFKWTMSIDAGIFSGDGWVPADYLTNGKLIISNRRGDIDGSKIWSFYENGMAALGWTLISAAPPEGSNNYKVTFTKGNRQATILIFNSDSPDLNQGTNRGNRIEILYK